MIDHQLWIDRLAANCTPLGGRVYDGAQYPHDMGLWADTPTVYVYPLGNAPESETGATARRQQIVPEIAVLVVVQSVQAGGKWVFSTLAPVVNAIDACYCGAGWVPPGCIRAPMFAGGQAEQIIPAENGDFLIWENRYSSMYLMNY